MKEPVTLDRETADSVASLVAGLRDALADLEMPAGMMTDYRDDHVTQLGEYLEKLKPAEHTAWNGDREWDQAITVLFRNATKIPQ